MKMDAKQEKPKWCPPCSLFSPPHHSRLLELLNLELIQVIRKRGDSKTHRPTCYGLLPLLYLMATNESQSGISLCVASGKWLAVEPECCNDELRKSIFIF